ncbi:MAG: hypothetical protein RL038_754, partial [Actinomycetota bacterium]
MRKLQALVATLFFSFSLFQSPVTASDLSLPQLWSQQFVGENLKLNRKVTSNSDYTRWEVSYRSNGLKITGVMNIPNGKGPFPVAILAHGY